MNKYIPFLKLKSNEILAIKEIEKKIRREVVPFFDFPRKDEYTEDSFKKTTERLARSVKKHLGAIACFYLDNFDIDSHLEIEGVNNYAYLLKAFKDLNFIPVVSIDRCEKHVSAVCDAKSSGALESEIFALRLVPEDFESFNVIVEEIEDNLGEVFDIFDDVDLILDCRVCLDQNIDHLTEKIISFAKSFSKSYPIRKLIVTGSSIPASIREVAGVESEIKLPRAELEIFNRVSTAISAMFSVVLGDYGVVSPNYSDLNIIPEAMLNVTAPKIIYAFENNHYIIRGGAIKTHKRGFYQYFDLAEILVAKDFYRGKEYSFGDRFLEEKSCGIGSCVTPSTILKPALNAHITFMLKDYVCEVAC